MTRWPAAALLLLTLVGCVPTITDAPGPAIAEARLLTGQLIAPDGTELPLRSWLPDDGPRAVIIALHGFNDYSNFIAPAAVFFAKQGIATYAYDQRGFGAAPARGFWAGGRALTSDLNAAVKSLRARHPGLPVYLLGESMGSAVIITATADDDAPDVDGVILSAPAVWGRAWMPWYQTTALWLAAHTFPSGRLSGGGLGIRPSDNVEMLRQLGRDPLVIKRTRVDAIYGLVDLMDQAMAAAPALGGRTLVLYGGKDQLIPPDAIRELLDRMPPSGDPARRIGYYPDSYHLLLRDLDAEIVWRDIASWIDNPAAPLPAIASQRSAAEPDNRPFSEPSVARLAAGEGFALRSRSVAQGPHP